jgi:hypothetical protein
VGSYDLVYAVRFVEHHVEGEGADWVLATGLDSATTATGRMDLVLYQATVCTVTYRHLADEPGHCHLR